MADKPRSVWAEGTLAKIIAVYDTVAEVPKWDDLSPALKIAFITVYMQGRKDALEEQP